MTISFVDILKARDSRLDISQLDQLVEDFGPRLFRFFQHKGFREESADCVQETFLRFIEKHSKFDAQKGDIRSFLFGISQMIALEKHRRKKKWLFFSATEEDPFENEIDPVNLLEVLEIKDHVARLEAILSKIDPFQRDLIYLFYDEELTTREIAEVMKLNEGTVKSHLSRTREKLKTLLGKDFLNDK